MRIPTAAELLDVWERGLRQPPVVRALMLLELARPGDEAEDLGALPVGERDRRLGELRERLFGADLVVVATCPRCSAELESSFPSSKMREPSSYGPEATHTCYVDDITVRYRLPTSNDLLALTRQTPPKEASARVLRHCVIDAQRSDGEAIAVSDLPAHFLDSVSAHMALADPLADLRVSLTCPVCANDWLARFDMTEFLWAEIQAWARRTLRDVSYLARSYGWREADILALSPSRRDAYLELSRQ